MSGDGLRYRCQRCGTMFEGIQCGLFVTGLFDGVYCGVECLGRALDVHRRQLSQVQESLYREAEKAGDG